MWYADCLVDVVCSLGRFFIEFPGIFLVTSGGEKEEKRKEERKEKRKGEGRERGKKIHNSIKSMTISLLCLQETTVCPRSFFLTYEQLYYSVCKKN